LVAYRTAWYCNSTRNVQNWQGDVDPRDLSSKFLLYYIKANLKLQKNGTKMQKSDPTVRRPMYENVCRYWYV
jgi:hypothetical protein